MRFSAVFPEPDDEIAVEQRVFIAAPGSTSKLKYFSSLQNEDRSKLRCDSKRKRLRRRRFDDVFCKVVGDISMTTTNYHL